jgi:hypothetical protein
MVVDMRRTQTPSLASRRSRRSSFDTRMLAAADALFREFDHLSVLDVVGAINSARRELSGPAPGDVPDPSVIAEVARDRLATLAA